MKKNPSDELFAQKLAEHRQEPSQRALERFQARLQEKEDKKHGGVFVINKNNRWYYAAAASIAIALTLGILSQKNEVPKEILAKNQTKKVEKIIENKPEIAKVETKENYEKAKIIKSTQLKKDSRFEIRDLKIQENQVAKNQDLEPKIDSLKIEKVSQNEVQLAAVGVPNNQAITDSVAELSKTTEPKTEKTETVLVFSDLPIEQDIAPVNSENIQKKGVDFQEDEPKEESFLKRFWTQLKRLKNGEKVDLKALKIRPKEVLAKADENFFKEERQDARESWQRLKSRFSKKPNN